VLDIQTRNDGVQRRRRIRSPIGHGYPTPFVFPAPYPINETIAWIGPTTNRVCHMAELSRLGLRAKVNRNAICAGSRS
jgi:hypothetical protein